MYKFEEQENTSYIVKHENNDVHVKQRGQELNSIFKAKLNLDQGVFSKNRKMDSFCSISWFAEIVFSLKAMYPVHCGSI